MSFSSTPLGQGRRLDHHTFLNKNNPNAPQRRAIPTSYSYGAPTVGSRSPPKPDKAPLPQEDDSEEPALVRFARLKQREQGQQSSQAQSTRSVGPRIIASPPHPENWSVRDTSVNIVSAFYQAATSTSVDTSAENNRNTSASNTNMNPNEAWASGIRKQPMVPRSTSVEYEKETQSTINRRLAPPPNRLQQARVTRPVSKSASIRHVPDSEGEEEVQPNGRAKTPLEQGYDIVRRLVPATFLLRERSQEPETSLLSPNGNESARDQSSYDYSAEEREFQATSASQKPPSRRTAAAHRKNRMSTDNKAYRPSMSDLEESDEDFEEDGKRTRRKKKKLGPAGGPLTTLPVAGYDKRKRRKKGGKENGAGEEEEEGSSEEEEQASEQRSQRGTTPFQRAPSIARGSVPPRQPSVPPHYDSSGLDNSMDIEGQLGPISELEEFPPQIDGAFPPTKSSFSVGAALGRVVHGFASLVRWIIGTLLGSIAWVGQAIVRPNLIKYGLVGLTVWFAWYALNSGFLDLSKLPIPRGHSPPYQAPEIPAADLAALSARLQTLEKAFASLSVDAERSRAYIEGDTKQHADVIGRIGSLETRVQKESIRAQDVETKHRAATNDGINAVKKEVSHLSAQLQSLRDAESRRPSVGSDEEARAKLKSLEDRVVSVEGGVKEAMDLGKNAVKAGVVSGRIAQWWDNIASGKTKGVTIRSSDGQDVTSLINQLVDTAVMRTSKDTIARVDFALHSSGASIIPSLTSDTMEIRPSTFGAQIAALLPGGQGYAIGRPPVTALHHETHTGHCWPFVGSQGQLGVALAAPVYITDVTIDHVAKEVAIDMRSAPRQMELWGMVEGQDNFAKLEQLRERRVAAREIAEAAGQTLPPSVLEVPYPPTLPRYPEYIRIANFTYNIHAPVHIQTFPVHEEVRELGIDFGKVVLLVKSNWGRDEFTCLYRLRVHGERMGEVPLPYPEEEAP